MDVIGAAIARGASQSSGGSLNYDDAKNSYYITVSGLSASALIKNGNGISSSYSTDNDQWTISVVESSVSQAVNPTIFSSFITPRRLAYVLGTRIVVASQTEAEAAELNTVLMTPLRTEQWYDKKVTVSTRDPNATERAAMRDGDHWIVRDTTAATF